MRYAFRGGGVGSDSSPIVGVMERSLLILSYTGNCTRELHTTVEVTRYLLMRRFCGGESAEINL